jgi:Na+/melibiose symporter-like transporter
MSISAPAPADRSAAPPLDGWTRAWYAVGQLADGVKNEAFALFLLFYYTAVLGLPGALAGQAILIALLFDAVTDPLMGVVSDRLHSRWGRRHPFLYVSAVPLGACFYLTFAPPPGLSHGELFWWLTGFAVGTRGAMTLFSVPHLALGAELSSDYHERTTIVTLQFVFARLGHAIAGMLAFLWYFRPTPGYDEGRFDPQAYPALALTLSVLMVAAVVMTAWRTHHRIPWLPRPDAHAKVHGVTFSLLRDFAELWRNPSFRALFLGLMLTYICWGVVTSLGLHFATYFWFVSNLELLVWGVFTGIGIFGGLPAWHAVAARIDKKPTFMWGLAMFTAFSAGPPLLKLAGWWPGLGGPLYIPLWCVTSGLLAHFGIAATMVTGRSMMADVTDEDALHHGRRRQGVFFGAVSFSAKAAFGVGGLIAGVVVQAVGLQPNQAPETAGPEIVQGLGLTLGLSLLLLCGLSLGFFSRYRITREHHAATRAALDARETTAVAAPAPAATRPGGSPATDPL